MSARILTPPIKPFLVIMWDYARRHWTWWAGPPNPLPLFMMPRVVRVRVPRPSFDVTGKHIIYDQHYVEVLWLSNDYSNWNELTYPQGPRGDVVFVDRLPGETEDHYIGRQLSQRFRADRVAGWLDKRRDEHFEGVREPYVVCD